MTRAAVAVALGVVVAACQSGPVPSIREVVRAFGIGWTVDLPADLGMEPAVAPSYTFGRWTAGSGEASRSVHLIVARRVEVPLEAYIVTVRQQSGGRIELEQPLPVPQGRAIFYRLSNPRLAETPWVILEPRAGVIATISARCVAEGDLIEIARGFRFVGP